MKFNHTLGFTLMEVLVSVMLFSFILLGFEIMQLTALKINRSAFYLTLATQQIENMKNRLKVEKENNNLSDLIEEWMKENDSLFPNAYGIVEGIYPFYIIKLIWGNTSQCTLTNCIQTEVEIR